MADLPADHRAVIEPVEEFFAHWLVFSDAPDHATLRTALLTAQASSSVQGLRGDLEHWTRETARHTVGRSADVVADFARPLALRCLEAVLGVSTDETAALLRLSSDLINYLVIPGSDLEAARVASWAIEELETMVFEVLLPRRLGLVTRPLAHLAAAHAVSKLSVVAAVAQFLTGTVEPTTTAIAVAVSQAARSERVRTSLAGGTLQAEAVVEEGLRLNPPFHFAPRLACRTFKVHDQTIRATQRVVLLLASANRDERRWDDAASFNPFRTPQRHLAFGRGAHACLGATLARLQTAEAVRVATEFQLLDDFAAPLERLPSVGATTLRRVPLLAS